jgi:hypothetical protein
MNWFSLFDFVSKPVTQYLETRGEIKKAKHVRDLAIIDNQARLAQDEASHNHHWEMESLKGNSQWLRLICFVQLALPLTITCIWPDKGREIFINLEIVPAWFTQLYMIVIGSIWGIHEFKSAAPQVIGALLSRKK